MYRYNCDNCYESLLINKGRKHSSNSHFLLCKSCKDDYELCSLTQCKQNYLLTENDLFNLKHLYYENVNNIIKQYKKDDVEFLAINKFGDMDKVVEQKTINKRKILIKQKNKDKEIRIRAKNIRDTFLDNKLNFDYSGDCYSYINYGTPSIENVVEKTIQKNIRKNKRRLKLARKLTQKNLPFDESIKPCYQYINNMGPKRSLKEATEAIQNYYYKNDEMNLVVEFE